MTSVSERDRPILLFYADFDDHGPPSSAARLKRRLHRAAKRVANRPTVTGFEMWTLLLIQALRRQGRTVSVNDYRAARSRPHYPVGLTGYPGILDWWDLPNPAILGPGMFDHPAANPNLMGDPRFRNYIVTCEWMHSLFEPYYGPTVVDWHAGIDTSIWTDASSQPKSHDCLVYDKIRWDRNELVPTFLEPIKLALAQRGLRFVVLRYGHHSQAVYRRLLTQSRFMLFLCEHETQGLAYQEAMASNLPVLAWDPGFWKDPNRTNYTAAAVPTSSVPFFGAECGETFTGIDDFVPTLDRFLESLPGYQPRRFVGRELSLSRSAQCYASYYDALAN